MNRYTIIGLAVGFLLGLFVGYNAGTSHGAGPSAATQAAPAMPSMPQMPPTPPQAPGEAELQGRIAMNQSIVARDPKNVRVWIQLGNDYFDTHQAQKAIEAYGRALELEPDDPDVLTDQGVMYRALGQFDKAISNFEKANRADPKHVQSLFNMGVVYANDLKRPKEATQAWSRVIQIAPQSEQAASARAGIEELKASAGK